MNCGNRNERRRIQCVHHGMNALQETANSFWALFFGNGDGLVIQLAQVSARRKGRLPSAVNNARGSFRGQGTKSANKDFQFLQRGRANFVGWLTVERQLDASLAPFPAQRLALEGLHACCLLTASRSFFSSYMALISETKRALTASR